MLTRIMSMKWLTWANGHKTHYRMTLYKMKKKHFIASRGWPFYRLISKGDARDSNSRSACALPEWRPNNAWSGCRSTAPGKKHLWCFGKPAQKWKLTMSGRLEQGSWQALAGDGALCVRKSTKSPHNPCKCMRASA